MKSLNYLTTKERVSVTEAAETYYAIREAYNAGKATDDEFIVARKAYDDLIKSLD